MLYDRAQRRVSFWRGTTNAGDATTVINNLPDQDWLRGSARKNSVKIRDERLSAAGGGGAAQIAQIAWDSSKHGKGTKVKRKSDRRVSTMNRDSDGEIKIKFDDDGSESGYINTGNVWVLVTLRQQPHQD